MKSLLVICLVLFTQPVLASMSLDKILVYLDAVPSARNDIVVTNPDEENLYLATEVFRVDNPGLENEQRVKMESLDDYKLLVSPSKAVLASGERKRIRLVNLEHDLKKEQVYRVTFKPVVGDVKTEKLGLKILIGYQALVFVQPTDGHYKVNLIEKDGNYRFSNSGNINIEVAKVTHCTNDGECRKLDVAGRLYPGTELAIKDMPSDGELKVFLRGRESELVRFPLNS